MLIRVEARNAQGSLLSLPLDDVSSGIIFRGADGLDPVKANIVSSSFANMDGEQYQSARREKRNLTLQLGMESMYGGGTVADIRNRIYGFFMPKTQVDLTFFLDNGLTLDISGRVESCSAPMFVQEPRLDAVILCHQPDFVDLSGVHLTGSTVSTTTETAVTYNGTVETGIVFTLNVDRSLSDFTIYNNQPDGQLVQLDFQAPLLAGDVLTISTVPGNKYARVLRGGSTIPILYGVSPYANWISLFPGVNGLRVYAAGAAIPYTIDYTTKYGAI